MVPSVRERGQAQRPRTGRRDPPPHRRRARGQGDPGGTAGGTFTLNNYGVFGVDGSAAIINHPEVAILGIGRIIDKPWVVNGELAVRKVTELTLTFDHRVCDGGTAGGFLRYVADAIENPGSVLAISTAAGPAVADGGLGSRRCRRSLEISPELTRSAGATLRDSPLCQSRTESTSPGCLRTTPRRSGRCSSSRLPMGNTASRSAARGPKHAAGVRGRLRAVRRNPRGSPPRPTRREHGFIGASRAAGRGR